MSLILDGTNGVSDIDGSASTPAIRGTDTNTGIFFPSADTIAFAEGGAEVARFDSAGNLGIGVTNPSFSGFSTASNGVVIKSANTYGLLKLGGATGEFYVGSGSSSAAWLWNQSNSPIVFATNGADRGRFDENGNLLVGTTGISTGTFKGIQNAAGGADANYLSRNSSGTAGRQWSFGMNSSDQYVVYGFNGTSFTSGAYIAYGGTSWTASSDERKKDIIEPITDAVNKVSTLRAVIGKYKTDAEGTRRSFLIAQDVQAVLPEAVDASDPDNLGVQYTEVIPLLVASIKEQQEIITDLRLRIEALEVA